MSSSCASTSFILYIGQPSTGSLSLRGRVHALNDRSTGSFAEHDLDAEPCRTDQSGHDHGDDGLECIALRLFDALTPTPQMLKIGAHFLPIRFLNSEGRQRGRDRPQNDGIDVIAAEPLLFGQRLGHNGPDILVAQCVHRLIILATFSKPRGARELVETGKSGWLVASLSTLGMVTFIPALQLTKVSNVAIIIATGPFVAAGIAWIWLGEATRRSTLIAGLVALCGIAIIVGSPAGAADFRGIGLACIMTVAIAAMTVAVRRHKQNSMVAAAALSNFLGSVVSVPFADGLTNVTGRDLGVLAMFGLFQVGMGLTLFVLGSRLLPSGQASLIATLETPLMPFWVWLAFHELPTERALIGGSLVMGAVVADIVADNWTRTRPGAAGNR